MAFEIIPLNQRVRMLDNKAEVWYEHTGELPLKEGDVVIIISRVHETKRAGGYKRGKDLSGPVSEHAVTRSEGFQLDIAETFLMEVREG